MSLLYEIAISKLGGGITFHFKPQKKEFFISPVGVLCDELFIFNLGVEVDGIRQILPFSNEYEKFDYVEQDISLTSLTYRAKSYKFGLNFEVSFISPFYPRDEVTSVAPFFYVKIRIKKTEFKYDDGKKISGKLVFEIKNKNFQFHKTKNYNSIKGYYTAKFKVNKNTGLMDLVEDPLNKFFAELVIVSVDEKENIDDIEFDVSKDKEFKKEFIVSMYCSQPIIKKDNSIDLYFLYSKYFKNIKEVVNFAVKNKEKINMKSMIFNSILKESSLSKTKQDFISYSFFSYIINTRWVYDKNTQMDFFTVIEGNCGYHSTVDVEYNIALFYFLIWPELLKKEIELWIEYTKNGYVPHDVGALFEIYGQVYPHNMEVEENCNLILLIYNYWKWTGDFEVISKNYNLLKQLTIFVINCDKNKNGFPDTLTANTVDDASAAIQFSKEQIYLGIKTFSALTAMNIISKKIKDINFAKFCMRVIKKIKNTLDTKAWLKDHYIVCLDKMAKNLVDVWSGKKINGILEGWDAYSIYTANGLLYLLLSDTSIKLNIKRIKTDILSSKLHNMTEYGCTHSSQDKSNLWISQNLWQDFVGMYFGFDFSDNMERYWQFELLENSQARGGCFVDTYGWNFLHYYPRGITSIGILYALAGIKVDAERKVIKFSPVKVPLKIPLVSFADWTKGRFPIVEFLYKNGKVYTNFVNKNLIKEYKVKMACL